VVSDALKADFYEKQAKMLRDVLDELHRSVVQKNERIAQLERVLRAAIDVVDLYDCTETRTMGRLRDAVNVATHKTAGSNEGKEKK
jgi:hypothetical protein